MDAIVKTLNYIPNISEKIIDEYLGNFSRDIESEIRLGADYEYKITNIDFSCIKINFTIKIKTKIKKGAMITGVMLGTLFPTEASVAIKDGKREISYKYECQYYDIKSTSQMIWRTSSGEITNDKNNLIHKQILLCYAGLYSGAIDGIRGDLTNKAEKDLVELMRKSAPKTNLGRIYKTLANFFLHMTESDVRAFIEDAVTPDAHPAETRVGG